MSIMTFTLAVLLSVGGINGFGDAARDQAQSLDPSSDDVALLGMEGPFVGDCQACHHCVIPGYYYTTSGGGSTLWSPYPIWECEPQHVCDCEVTQAEDDAQPEEVQALLATRIEEGGRLSADELFLLDTYFDVKVSNGVAAVRNSCERVVAWLRVETGGIG